MRLRHVIPIAALSLIAQGASAQVNLLINGGFESPVVPSPGFSIFLQIPGWTTTSGAGIEIQSGGIAGTPFEGNQLVETDSAGNSGFEQIVPTVAGQAHTFDFVYSPRPGVAAASNTVDIVVNGNVVDTLSADGSALADTSWVRHAASSTTCGSSPRALRRWRRRYRPRRCRHSRFARSRSPRSAHASVAQLATGELDEEILEVRRPMQVSDAGVRREIGEQGRRVVRVAEGGFTGELEARGERAPARLRPRLRRFAVHLDDFGLDVLREERPRRVAGDQRAVIDHGEARREPLRLVHEVRREQDRLALLQ